MGQAVRLVGGSGSRKITASAPVVRCQAGGLTSTWQLPQMIDRLRVSSISLLAQNGHAARSIMEQGIFERLKVVGVSARRCEVFDGEAETVQHHGRQVRSSGRAQCAERGGDALQTIICRRSRRRGGGWVRPALWLLAITVRVPRCIGVIRRRAG